MKSKLLLSFLIAALALPLMAAPPASLPSKGKAPKSASVLDTDTWIDANKILMFVTNDGVFGTDLGLTLGKTDGLYFPYTSVDDIISGANNTSVIYASGIWIGAVDAGSGDTLVAIAEYGEEYGPGPMIGGTYDPAQFDRGGYRVYKIYRDSTDLDPANSHPNQDWLQWPVDQGAPTFFPIDSIIADTIDDTTITADTFFSPTAKPLLLGDQTLWTVFNDANPALHTTNQGSTDPLGVEVQLTTFAFDREDPFGNIVFLQYKVINKGGKDLRDVYVSLWADPDLGGASDDLVGSDTILSLGYTYNATNKDNSYGSRPPAVGYDFFQGPLEETSDSADTAQAWGQLYPGFRNLPMASFNKYINGTDPSSYFQAYLFMQGYDKQSGEMVPYEYNGEVLQYQKSGDPVAGTGDLDNNPADRRMMLTTGPFDFAPGDSTQIVAAIIVGQGADRKSSISALKYFDRFAQDAYDRFFQLPNPPATPIVSVSSTFEGITLSWSDRSERQPGDYPFEGYTVSQGESPSGPWVRLNNFDVANDVTVIFEEQFDLANGVLVQAPTKFGTDQGVQRYITIREDVIGGGTLNNFQEYYYKIDAYSYTTDTTVTQRTLTSSTVVTAIPRGPTAGTQYDHPFGDTVTYTHAGTSDGAVHAIVLDPTKFTGDQYQVSFFVDTTIGIRPDTTIDEVAVPPDTTIVFVPDTLIQDAWRVVNTTTGDTVVPVWYNQQGGEDYPIVDGMLFRVLGPALDFKGFLTVANANGPIDPPVAAAFGALEFPTPLDEEAHFTNPPTTQQTTGQRWVIHTADNGGTGGGGTRSPYSAFLSRVTRDGANWPEIIPHDYEWRFTGSNDNPGVGGSYGFEAFGDGNVFWVPFELWDIGVGTPDDPSDDYQMVPWVLDDAGAEFEGDDMFALESWGGPDGGGGDWEHSASGGLDDPYTDWVYWARPTNTTPGTAGYDAAEALMLGGTYEGADEHEVMARMVLVAWNGGAAPPFANPTPEQGTVFRILSTKPNTPTDTFLVTPTAPRVVANEDALKNVRVVPNPYYLAATGPCYDPNTYNRRLKFTNLPNKCTISIYNLAGDLVDRLEKDDAGTSEAIWDIETASGIPVASGIYLYVVESPGFGQKIGKFAVFTEKEQLNTY